MSAGVSPSPNGIVEIRRQSASGVLDSLQTALEIIDKQANTILALQNAIIEDKNAIERATNLLRTDLNAVKNNVATIYGQAGQIDRDVHGPIQSAEEHLQQLNDALAQARATANRVKRRHVDSSRLLERKESLESRGRARLRRATQGDDPLKDLKSIWEEGLDLLSGLCLRNEGLDDGLCRFADAIVAEINWRQIKAITVPGRGGPGHLTSIIHLRFPEWTVWALPLTAHELWHLGRRSEANQIDESGANEVNSIMDDILDVLGEEKRAKLKQIAGHNWNNPELQRCLGDVFAVHVMGPAFACAAISLVLDPHETECQQRALSILSALDADNEYSEMHKLLDIQWRQASKDSMATKLQYADWIDALLEYLNSRPTSKFYLERWKQVRKPWCDALLNDEVEKLDVERTDLRHALTAAWKARLEWPSEAGRIAKNCAKLCEKILTYTPPRLVPGI